MTRSSQYIALRRTCTSFILAAIGLAGPGCGEPDRHTIRGALAVAARALEDGDGRALFAVIDPRARSALGSVVRHRQEAARLIATHYPEADQPAALAALGRAAEASDAADLFTRRCAAGCRAELAAAVGAPVAEEPLPNGDVEVRTVRGGRLRMHRGDDGRWGIFWRNEALNEERTRAARELTQIRHNAEVYRRRRALETAEAP
jgi:hypothetical protein